MPTTIVYASGRDGHILRALVELGKRWAGDGGAPDDDVTMIVMKRR